MTKCYINLRALSTLYFLSSNTSLKNWLTLVFIFSSLYFTLKIDSDIDITCMGQIYKHGWFGQRGENVIQM